MTHPFAPFALALTTAALLLVGSTARRAFAQPPASARVETYPEVEEAKQLMLHQPPEFAAAGKLLEAAARKYPELPSAHVLMYGFLIQLGRRGDALIQLDEAIKANPSDPEPYIILGDYALQERRLNDAAMEFDKAKQLMGTYSNAKRKGPLEQHALSGIAEVSESRHAWSEAESSLKDFVRTAPEDVLGLQRLARAQFLQSKGAEAYETLKNAKKIDRANSQKYGTRETMLTPEAIMAQYYVQLEGPASASGHAEKFFNAAVQFAPNDIPTRQAVATWALSAGSVAVAKAQAEAIIKIETDPKFSARYAGSTVGRELRGLVAMWEKDWPKAEDYFKQLVLESPDDIVAKNNLALALVAQKDPKTHKLDPNKIQRAMSCAESNYSKNVKSPEALSTLGWVYFQSDQFEEAARTLQQVVNVTGGWYSADTATYAAYLFDQQNKKYEAKLLLEGVLKGDRPFSMRKEAQALYEKVKDATKPSEPTGATGP